MLAILPNNILDGIDESLYFTQVLIKKGFKFFLGNENVSLIFYVMLVLLLAEQGGVLQESGCK